MWRIMSFSSIYDSPAISERTECDLVFLGHLLSPTLSSTLAFPIISLEASSLLKECPESKGPKLFAVTFELYMSEHSADFLMAMLC